MNSNQQELASYLNKLNHSPIFSDVVIKTIGIRFHLLKDTDEKIYCLVVPNKPLHHNAIEKFKELGFQEKFKKINFTRFFSLHDVDEVIKITEKVLSNILNVPTERQWRFDIHHGMALIKNNQPESPNAARRKMIRERNNKPLNIFKKKYGIKLVISLILSIILVLNYEEHPTAVLELIGLILLLTIGLTLLMKIIETIENWFKNIKYNR